ncbi:MAG: response regulator [Planctomycetota bacterium]|nr:response regulator [Planctomycetota bacterium]
MEDLNVLLIEDSAMDAELVLRELRRSGFQCTHRRVETEETLRGSLEGSQWDVVLCDYNMPRLNAPQALGVVRNADPDLPFIVVSGSIGEHTAVNAMRAGAQDYIMKDNITRLGEAIRREVREAQRRRANRKTEEDLRLKEEELRQSQKLEAIGRLAGGVAHDFNNLLTVIIGRSNLLVMHMKEDDPVRKEIEIVLQASWRASDLTRQLLAFSRQQVLQPKLLDLNRVVSDAERMLQRLIGEDIEFVLDLEANLGRVLADEGQLGQIILNFTVNARDAMPSGGKLVLGTRNVRLDEAHEGGVLPGEYVVLFVRDTGTGMSPETQKRLFEPFFTTKEPGKGTGLGLSVVYGIVKQSGGSVQVESELGKGSAFSVFLPRAEGEPDEEKRADSTATPAGQETVLLVEDDDQVRDLLVESLRSFGYRVLAAPSGERAMAICGAETARIDLLVTDLIMSKVNGLELAGQIKAVRPGIRVLYISGFTDHALLSGGATDGTSFLQKPFTPAALARKIREVFAPADS